MPPVFATDANGLQNEAQRIYTGYVESDPDFP
jgi:hypothetical protein